VTALAIALRTRTFRSLRRHRNYRIFFAGQVVSLAGTWMQNVALAWLVLELSGSPLAVGALAFWRFVPFTLFSLAAGVVADRLETRKLVMGTQAAAMVVSAALAVVTLTGTATLPIVYVLAALGGIAIAFDAPGRQSLTFQLVGRRELPNAVALNTGLFNGSRVIGPAIAGLIIAAAGTGVCFVINAFSFLAVLAALAIMRSDELHPVERDPSARIVDGLRRALAFLWKDPQLRSILGVVTVVSTVGFNFHVLVPLLAADTLDVGRGIRPPVRVVRFGRSRRCSHHGVVPRGKLAPVCDRNHGVRRWRRSHSRRSERRSRSPPLRDRDRLHALHCQCERTVTRRSRPSAGTADWAVSLRVPRPRSDRRPLRRMAREHRRHGAGIHRRRTYVAGDDRCRKRAPDPRRRPSRPARITALYPAGSSSVRMSHKRPPSCESVKAMTESWRESGYSTASGDGRFAAIR
jgi:hypothetical protein